MRIKINAENCTGCKACETVCSLNEYSKILLGISNIKVINSYVKGRRLDIPHVCRNCKKAVCIEACPREAIREEGGIVILDSNLCDNCGLCIESCTFGSIFRNENHEITKCNFCDGKLLCVKFCATGAIEMEE